MQQETPQSSQPAPQPPVTPPTPPSTSQGGQGESFYQPSTPASYAAPSAGHASLPSPYAAPLQPDQPAAISWEASEYVHNDKGGLWLVGLGVVGLLFAGVALYLQAWTFLALIVVMTIAMGIFAFRKPHVLHYTLNDNGVQIGDKTFHYSDFRAFGILEDGAFYTMTLIPIKRFAPSLSVYFSEEQGEDIVDIVGAHLPMEHIEPDFIDHLMRRLRF